MSRRARARPSRRIPGEADPGTPSLSAGYLAALPLFLGYELALALEHGPAPRAAAERVAAHVLLLFGGRLQWVRLALLLGAAGWAWVRWRRECGPGAADALRRLARLVGEGVLAGFLLGPLLFALQSWLAHEPLSAAPGGARNLLATLRLLGAAPWEELLFRVGLYGSVFLLVRRASTFLGLDSRLARLAAELGALLASALVFAWFHLDQAQRLIGGLGEPFHQGLFLWRVSAGLVLGALFRLRGFGVAAWAHAVFNLGIALGIRP